MSTDSLESISLSAPESRGKTNHKLQRTITIDRKRKGNKSKILHRSLQLYTHTTQMTKQRRRKNQQTNKQNLM